jgi:hypothetical protein
VSGGRRGDTGERPFGVPVGGLLLVISAIVYWRGSARVAAVLAGIGLVLAVLGWMAPRLLRPLSNVWWRVAMVLGYINARVILTLLFALIFVPMSFVWRITGRDALRIRRGVGPGWSRYPERYRDAEHFKRMY